MEPTNIIWQNGRYIPWAQAMTHVLSHGLHYGTGVFEGIRFYHTAQGPAIFKLREHVARLFYSASAIGMTLPFSIEQIEQAIIETVNRNQVEAGYIRPIAYFGYGSMKVTPSKDMPVDVVIACWPWGSYLTAEAVDIKVSEFIRIHPKSTVADAKICGHYVNSLLAGQAIQGTHYHEALLLDMEGYVAEGSAENIFIVKDGVIYTTPLGTILDGITRQTVIEIAQQFGHTVKECRFLPQDIQQADEAFFCGTAVEVTPIRSLDDCVIANGKPGQVTLSIQAAYQDIVHARHVDYYRALTFVNGVKEEQS